MAIVTLPKNNVLQGYLDQWMQSQDRRKQLEQNQSQFDTTQQSALTDKRTAVAEAVAKMTPEAAKAFIAALPPEFQNANLAPRANNLQETANDKFMTDAITAHDSGKQFTPDPLFAGAASPDLAGKAPWMNQAGQRNTYTDAASPAPQLPAAMNTSQQMADGLAESVPDKAKRLQQQSQYETTLNQIEKPRTNAYVNEANAQAGHANAQTGLVKAQAGQLAGSGGTGSMATGDDYLKTLPAITQSLVKKIANYEMDISKVTSLRGGDRERIAQMVAQYDPSFDMTQYGARAASRKDFNSGKAAQNIRSINTAVKHLDSLSKAADQLENRSFPAWNAVANTAVSAGGGAAPGNFETAANAVASEMAAIFKNGGATDQEIKNWRQKIGPNASPEQIKGSISTMIDLMSGRLAALSAQYGTAMGKPKDFQILSPKSREILKRLGANPDEIESGNITTGAADPLGILK